MMKHCLKVTTVNESIQRLLYFARLVLIFSIYFFRSTNLRGLNTPKNILKRHYLVIYGAAVYMERKYYMKYFLYKQKTWNFWEGIYFIIAISITQLIIILSSLSWRKDSRYRLNLKSGWKDGMPVTIFPSVLSRRMPPCGVNNCPGTEVQRFYFGESLSSIRWTTGPKCSPHWV